MTASVVVEQSVVTRWPGPAAVHWLEHGAFTVFVPYTEGMPAAE